MKDKGEYIMNTSEFLDTIERTGINNITFFVPMTVLRELPFGLGVGMKSSNDPLHYVECYIDESRYKVSDEYKVQLRAFDSRYGSETYYLESLIGQIKQGRIKIKEEGDYVEVNTVAEKVSPAALLKTTFELIRNRYTEKTYGYEI